MEQALRKMVRRLGRGRFTRILPKSLQAPYIWQGIYPNFQSVPAVGAGHAEPEHIERAVQRTLSFLARLQTGVSVETPEVPAEYSHFPLLAAVVNLDRDPLSVLDVGGGLGIGYAYLRASAPRLKTVRYHIVEVPEISQAGSELFRGNAEITFQNQLPRDEATGEFDLVQLCSSLQYFEDFESVVAHVSSCRARFVYLLKTPVGNFPTFATAQYNLPGSVVPVWFFNYQELVQLFADSGYCLVYEGTHDRVYDTTNFEPAYRMNRYSNLLFVRNESDA